MLTLSVRRPIDRFEDTPRISGFDPPRLPGALAETSGTMEFEVIVDREGALSSIELIQGLGEELDALMLRESGKWEFEPGRVQNKPVVSRLWVRVRFVPNQEPSVTTRTRR